MTEAWGSGNRQEPCRAPGQAHLGLRAPEGVVSQLPASSCHPRDSVPGSEGQPGRARSPGPQARIQDRGVLTKRRVLERKGCPASLSFNPISHPATHDVGGDPRVRRGYGWAAEKWQLGDSDVGSQRGNEEQETDSADSSSHDPHSSQSALKYVRTLQGKNNSSFKGSLPRLPRRPRG